MSEVFLEPSGSNSHSLNSSSSKRKGSDEGDVCSPVAVAEKKILFGVGQKISLGWSTMGRKCDATNSYGLNKQTGAEFQKVKLLFSISIFIIAFSFS